MKIENAKAMKEKFICKIKNKNNTYNGIGYNVVSVGYPPSDVTDFKCRSQNRENLQCDFTQNNNTVITTYKLAYTVDIIQLMVSALLSFCVCIQFNFNFFFLF